MYSQHAPDKAAADESGSTGNKDGFFKSHANLSFKWNSETSCLKPAKYAAMNQILAGEHLWEKDWVGRQPYPE
jgi:hypothetical protein